MNKQFNLLIVVILAAVVGVGCGGEGAGDNFSAKTTEAKIRNVFRSTEVAAKKEALKNSLKNILNKSSVPEEKEKVMQKNYECFFKNLEEILVTHSKTKKEFNEGLADIDSGLKIMKDARPVVTSLLNDIKSKISSTSTPDEINQAIQALPPAGRDLIQNLMRSLELDEEIQEMIIRDVALALQQVTIEEMIECYDALYDLCSKIREGLQGVIG